MNWQDTNLGVNDIGHYVKIYRKAAARNPNIPGAADKTFRATVGRFVGKGENKQIDSLLSDVKKALQANS
jgi:hypothetical protein